jgi:predicted nuclease of restriction endonuclease-like (RecB) superfamily
MTAKKLQRRRVDSGRDPAAELLPVDYASLLADVKARVRSARYLALEAVNKQLVGLYWDIGRMIVERQIDEGWGQSVVGKLADDLRQEFPGIKGFSSQNLWYMRQLHLEYRGNAKLQPLVGEVAWSHNLVIMSRCKEKKRTVVEYALRDARKPIGVATYQVVKRLPQSLKGQLPSPEQIAKLLEDEA